MQPRSILPALAGSSLIKIEGRGFGEALTIDPETGETGDPTGERPSIGSRISYVVFPGDGGSIAVQQDSEYNLWLDNEIQVRVPPGAKKGIGLIRIVIYCQSRNPISKRSCIATKNSDDSRTDGIHSRALNIIVPPEINRFGIRSASDLDVLLEENEIIACEPISIEWEIDTFGPSELRLSSPILTEELIIHDAGIIDSGSFLIERSQLVNPFPGRTFRFTLNAFNFCNRDSTPSVFNTEVLVEYPILADTDELEIVKNGMGAFTMRITCLAPEGGYRFMIIVSNPSIATVISSEVLIEEGTQTATIEVQGVQSGVTEVVISGDDPFISVSVPIYITPILTRILPENRSFINQEITIEGRGLIIPGESTTEVAFPKFRSTDTSNVLVDSGSTEDQIIVKVPEDVDNGELNVLVGNERISSDSGLRLSIEDPIISDVMAISPSGNPRRGSTIRILGKGYSQFSESNEIDYSGVSGLIEGRNPVSDGTSFEMVIPEDAPFRSSIQAVISPSEGRERTSDAHNLNLFREPGNFRRISLQTTNFTQCGISVTISLVNPELGSFRYSLSGSSVRSDTFRVQNDIGGVAFTPCCNYFVVLGYIRGAFTFGAPSLFHANFFEVSTGNLAAMAEINTARSMEMGSRLPEVWVSSGDCTVALTVGFVSERFARFSLFDLPGEEFLGGDQFALDTLIDSSTTRISDENEIFVNGRRIASIPL